MADEFSDLIPTQGQAAPGSPSPVQPILTDYGPQGYVYLYIVARVR